MNTTEIRPLMFSIRREIWFPDFQGPERSIARALLTNLTARLWALTLALRIQFASDLWIACKLNALDDSTYCIASGDRVTRYRKIEINAFRRRVTIVSGISGEWPRDTQPSQTDEGVLLNDSESCEPIEPDSPEGQLLLVEAVRSLERRLSPEVRASLSTEQRMCLSYSNGVYRKVESLPRLIWRKVLCFIQGEK
jgi:hypothetical protein